MNFNFAEALASLGFNAAARIANAARPPASYLFSQFLPERTRPDYNVDAANMIVKSTMAGLVAMDSPYPDGGAVTLSQFLERSAKIAIQNRLKEEALRELQALMRQMMFEGTLTNTFMVNEALNFYQKVIIQALLDRAEWLRGQALVMGLINWTYNKKNLLVDYGIPPSHKLTERTDSNNDAYGDSGSKFWADWIMAHELLRYNVRAVVMTTPMWLEILNNPVNNILPLTQNNQVVTFTRYVNLAGNTLRDPDARYQGRIVLYDEAAEVLNTAGDDAGTTQLVPFMPDTKILYVGQNRDNGYRVGEGSTDDPRNDMELGYYHIAPTTEGNGNPGRWGRLFTPQDYPMQLMGQGVENSLPVITAPNKIVIATSERMS